MNTSLGASSHIAISRRKIVPDSKSFDNHLLIDPVAALLDREDAGYRDLRKALVRFSLSRH